MSKTPKPIGYITIIEGLCDMAVYEGDEKSKQDPTFVPAEIHDKEPDLGGI